MQLPENTEGPEPQEASQDLFCKSASSEGQSLAPAVATSDEQP